MNIKTYRPIFFQVISFLIPILSFGLLSNRLLINANQLYIKEFSLYLSLVSITSLLEFGQQNALILSVSKIKKNDLRLEPYLITCLYWHNGGGERMLEAVIGHTCRSDPWSIMQKLSKSPWRSSSLTSRQPSHQWIDT